jgi:hypothetical protein
MIRASILALMISASSAAAQSQCTSIDEGLAWLAAQHYAPKSAGNIAGGKVVVYVNEKADWIIVAMNAEAACIINAGTDWALMGVDG